jgi:hypothetical protein
MFSKLYHPLARKKSSGTGSITSEVIKPTTDNDNPLSSDLNSPGKPSHNGPDIDFDNYPEVASKNVYMADLVNHQAYGNHNWSSANATSSGGSPQNPLHAARVSNRRGPLVERQNQRDSQQRFRTEGDSPSMSCEVQSATLTASQGGLKIFQKLSESIMHRKQSTMMKGIFSAPSPDSKFGKIQRRLLETRTSFRLPELPTGTRVKLSICSNWGDFQE